MDKKCIKAESFLNFLPVFLNPRKATFRKMMIALITLLSIGAASVYFLLVKSFSHFTRLGVPQFSVAIPYGNIKGIFTDYQLIDFVVKYYKKTKDIGAKFSGVYVYIRPTLFVVDLDLVQQILFKDSDKFSSSGFFYDERDDPVSAHLFNLDGSEGWRALRKNLTPTSEKMKTIVGISENLLSVIDKKIIESGQLEVKDILSRFTIDVIGSTAFGIECSAVETQELELYRRALKINVAPKNFADFFVHMVKGKWMNLSRKLGTRLIPEDQSSLCLDTTRKTVHSIELKNKNGKTVEQTVAQFWAGFETSSSTMTFCIYELSLNEEIQEKARESVREAVAKHNGLNYEAIEDMHYLKQCLDETLRKYPIVPVLIRSTTQEGILPSTRSKLPQGQAVCIPIYGIHHDPEIYPEPSKFIPDRFAQELKDKRHPCAFIPFGKDPRISIGLE